MSMGTDRREGAVNVEARTTTASSTDLEARPRPREADVLHTRLLRLALGAEESRSYWENGHDTPSNERSTLAFEERWFGGKSLERVRFLLSSFVVRYDAFPEALHVLRRWRRMETLTRKLICHWHLQLSDPLYRAFTGTFLVERARTRTPESKVDRDIVRRWLKTTLPERWSEATYVQFASKLLSAASEAGLVTEKRDPRALLVPQVPDLALAYLLQLLRGIHFKGTLLENPYLESVGLTGPFLDARLRKLSGLEFRRMAHLTELSWESPTLRAWAEETL